MPLSELHKKIHAEAAAQSSRERDRPFSSRPAAGAIVSDAALRRANLPSRADDRVSNVPVRPAPIAAPQHGLAVAIQLVPLCSIAATIERDWQNVNYAARPYLDALRELVDVGDDYGADSGASIVRYFLANALTWRGPVARIVKAELRRRVA